MNITIERVYDVVDQEPPAGEYWALVDRLWPRGIKKERLHFAEWDKEIAPSTDLRKAYHGGELSFEEFAAKYKSELSASSAAGALLERARASGAGTLVLLAGLKDPEKSQAAVLRDYLLALPSER